MEPLFLISEKLKVLQKSELQSMDIKKGKGNRDGLVQQIITYVRDGHTVTRKQWVRSEFADHAKKNEEEKKDTMLKEQERKENKRRNDIKDQNAKQATQDKRARNRVEKLKETETEHHARNKKVHSAQLDAYKKKLEQQRKKDEEERKKQDKKQKDKDKDKKKSHGAYGQQDKTKADNKAEQDMITKPK